PGRTDPGQQPGAGQVEGPDSLARQRQEALPALSPVVADPHTLLAAQVQRGGPVRGDRQGAHVTLDEHPLGGAAKAAAVVGTEENAFAHGAHIQPVRLHVPCSPGRESLWHGPEAYSADTQATGPVRAGASALCNTA